MTLHELKRRWSKLDVKRAAISIVAERKEDIIDKNREQLMDGFNKEKKRLKKYASPQYAAKKNRRNPVPGYGNPDLYDTGSFQQAMKLNIQSTTLYEITSTDSKTPDLKKKYGVTYQHTLVQVDAAGNTIKKWSGGNTLSSVLSMIQ